MTKLVQLFFGRDSGLEHEPYAHLWLANLLFGAVPILIVDSLLHRLFDLSYLLRESVVAAAGPLTNVAHGLSAVANGSTGVGVFLIVFGLAMFLGFRGAVRAALRSRYLGLRLSAFLVAPAWWISYITPYFLLARRS